MKTIQITLLAGLALSFAACSSSDGGGGGAGPLGVGGGTAGVPGGGGPGAGGGASSSGGGSGLGGAGTSSGGGSGVAGNGTAGNGTAGNNGTAGTNGTAGGTSNPDGGTVDGGDGGGEIDAGPPHTGECCAAHASRGCNNPTQEACVCARDSRCCDSKWDDFCVAQMVECGKCETKTDCCTAVDPGGPPGCADATVEACVCAIDDTCCSNEWDPGCVQLVTKKFGGVACGTCN